MFLFWWLISKQKDAYLLVFLELKKINPHPAPPLPPAPLPLFLLFVLHPWLRISRLPILPLTS